MSDELLQIFGHLAEQHAELSLQFMHAEVVSYNADDYTAIVKFKPEEVQSGDIPIYAPWSGTPGFNSGMQVGLEPGTLVVVFSFDANREHLGILGCGYSKVNQGPGAPAGAVYWVHKTGSYIKLMANGDLDFASPNQILMASPLVQLSDTLSALSDSNAIVRKSDLQVVIDSLNGLISALKGTPYLGNLGAPLTATGILAVGACPAATASSVAKAK